MVWNSQIRHQNIVLFASYDLYATNISIYIGATTTHADMMITARKES